MANDDHPLIKQSKQRSPGFYSDDRSVAYDQSALMMAFYSPADRVRVIQNVEEKLLSDEGSLRERAQLLSLHRHLSDADNNLRKAGR